ncbi:uncharacterized protein [Triticum aestivum]|nr:uncharacterized protein LOC123156417 isoform X3 [Triticum aestivum]
MVITGRGSGSAWRRRYRLEERRTIVLGFMHLWEEGEPRGLDPNGQRCTPPELLGRRRRRWNNFKFGYLHVEPLPRDGLIVLSCLHEQEVVIPKLQVGARGRSTSMLLVVPPCCKFRGTTNILHYYYNYLASFTSEYRLTVITRQANPPLQLCLVAHSQVTCNLCLLSYCLNKLATRVQNKLPTQKADAGRHWRLAFPSSSWRTNDGGLPRAPATCHWPVLVLPTPCLFALFAPPAPLLLLLLLARQRQHR